MPCSAKPSVYIADDDIDVLRSLRFLLEAHGFEVHTFRSGTALLNVLDALGQPPVSCFVIDYRMPDINGMDLVRGLRNRGVQTPIVLISGHYDGKLAARAAAAGVRDFLFKPLLDENLARCIRNAISGHPAGQGPP